MADANYNGLDQTPADYAVERGALWADKSNRRSRFGPTDTGARCVAEWGDDIDNAHRAMQARLAELLGLPIGRVSIKATTSERMGFTGREEGLAAFATATIRLPITSN